MAAMEAGRMGELQAFKAGLQSYLATDCHARPFVCSGSPLQCRSFIVGLNAATRLKEPFWCYWLDDIGFDHPKFKADYCAERPHTGRGNRPRIEAIAKEIAPSLETNLYAKPSMKASQLSKKDQENPIICYLFGAIRPALVFVHSRKPIRFFEARTGCHDFTSKVQWPSWQGHSFWLFGLDQPLYTLSLQKAAELGANLAPYLSHNK
jgi:hypothetical protein